MEVYADEGISGTHAKNRPGVQRMIDDAVFNKKIDPILTISLDRLSQRQNARIGRAQLICKVPPDVSPEAVGMIFEVSIKVLNFCFTSGLIINGNYVSP